MEETMFVHIGETEHGLEHNAFDLLFWERLCSVFHKLVNVLLHIFKYEVQVVIDSDDFFQLHDVIVI